MNKAYIQLARSVIEMTLKEMLLKFPKISFLAGWPISLISILFSPILGHLISSGILSLDFARIESKVSADGKQYFEFFKQLKEKDQSKLSDLEKEAIIATAKKVTKRFLSAKQYIKQ